MVKFGKEYRSLQLDEWKKYYFDYKILKRKIKEMKGELIKDLNITNYGKMPSLLETPLLPDESNEKGKANDIYKAKNGQYLKEFIELLVKEFKKSYNFFKEIEKVLIKKINNHLYIQTSYSAYSLLELSKEMKSLSLTVYLAKSLNAFINDIMTAIKKILKKFDKNFSHIYGLITPHLILQLLSKENSEFDYILEFKIIDEISIIAESSTKELKKYFSQNNDDNNEYRIAFIEKYNETLKYIKEIDELIYFKAQYKDWVDYVSGKSGVKSTKYLENDIFNPILSASYYKDNLLDKFLSTNEAFNEIKNFQKPIHSVNLRNIILILIQVFFYNTLLTCIFPVLYFYLYICGIEHDDEIDEFWFLNILTFLDVGSIYLAQFLSIFFFYDCVSIKQIKFSYTLSYSFILSGSILYILSISSGYRIKKEQAPKGDYSNINVGHYKVRALLLGISRFLVGLGSNPMLGKKYITLYTPKYYLPLISKIYLIIEQLGLIFGPCITILISFIRIGIYKYCLFNCIGYYGALGSLILIIFNNFLFTSPKNKNFFVVRNQTKDDVNISTSFSVQFDFEEDDSQDKEFYKLQKEAHDRKKAGLEPTKSDEIHIEINDNQTSTTGIINTSSNTINDEKEKEEDDINYNKIIENVGEVLGQDEIAENYYNNVDTERYSDLDISNEQRDTIKEIEEKLYEYQEKSNFSYINMIPRTLDDIILKEHKTIGYMNRNFILILLLLFFNTFIKQNLIIYSAYYILFIVYKKGQTVIVNEENVLDFSQNKRMDIQIICLLVSSEMILQLLSIFFIMPFYKVNLIFKKNLIIFMFLSVLLMIPLSIPFLDYIWLYIPLVSFDIFFHKIIEIMLSCYLVYLIPPQWKYAHIRASSLPIYLMTFAKMSACALCFLCFQDPKNEKNNMIKHAFKYNQQALTLIATSVYGMFGVFIYKSNNFRVKALARVLRKRAME